MNFTINQLILSQTWAHDHLLANADGIRKYFQTEVLDKPSPWVTENCLCNYDSGYPDMTKAKNILDNLTNRGQRNMVIVPNSLKLCNKMNCCNPCDKLYMGINVTEGSIELVCMLVKVSKYMGDIYHFDPVDHHPVMSFKDLLLNFPILISDLELHCNIDLVINMLQ